MAARTNRHLNKGGALRLTAALAAALILAGCASQRPVLYPNAQLEEAGRDGAESAVDQCIELANSAGAGNDPGVRIAKKTAKTATIGAATGAVAGAIAGGNAGRGAAIGAAGGATAQLVAGLFEGNEPDAIFRNYVNTCLSEKGYRIIGWR